MQINSWSAGQPWSCLLLHNGHPGCQETCLWLPNPGRWASAGLLDTLIYIYIYIYIYIKNINHIKIYGYLKTLQFLIPYHTLPYLTIPYHTLPYLTIPYHTLPYLTIPYPLLTYPLLHSGHCFRGRQVTAAPRRIAWVGDLVALMRWLRRRLVVSMSLKKYDK